MNATNSPISYRHGLSSSTHHRLGYPLAGWFSPEPTSVSPDTVIVHDFTSNTTRYASKNLRGLGVGPQAHLALRKGIRQSFSESVLTKTKTVADPFDFAIQLLPILESDWAGLPLDAANQHQKECGCFLASPA